MKKIAVVDGGALSPSIKARLALALADLVCVEVHQSDMAIHARPNVSDFEIAMPPVPDDPGVRADWYRRFAGKRGVYPRW